MTHELWKRKIGESAWNYISNGFSWRGEDERDQALAAVLDRLVECGWRPPERVPVVDPRGTGVWWPEGVVTPLGLIDHYEKLGRLYLVFRIPQLLRGVGQFLLPRLQEVVTAYESQCKADGVSPIPEGFGPEFGGK